VRFLNLAYFNCICHNVKALRFAVFQLKSRRTMKKFMLFAVLALSGFTAVEAPALPLARGPLAALRNGNGPVARIRARIQARRAAIQARRAAAQQAPAAAQSSQVSSSN
jgi:hypothetical protein